MGARLVSLALGRWTHVSDRAFRLLIRMAHTALDAPTKDAPANLYYGGRDLLAMTLRHEGGNDKTRYRAVKRLLAELVTAGAIERTHAGRVGQNAVYRLTLNGERAIDRSDSDSESEGGHRDPPQGGLTDPPEGGLDGASRGATETPPRNHEEGVEELLEEEEINLRTAVTGPRTREAAQEPFFTDEKKPHLRLVTDDEPPPIPARRGLGFCVVCYEHGQTVLAADPNSGSECVKHLREAS